MKKDDLDQLDILQSVDAGEQFQVVIGPNVGQVYDEIQKLGPVKSPDDQSDEVQDTGHSSLINRIFDVISGSFTPLIPVLCGSGLVKALATILLITGVVTAKDSTFLILQATGNAFFYFMPIILSVSIANKMKINAYTAAAVGAALMEPNFTSMMTSGKSMVHFFGAPVLLFNYSSTVLPVFISIAVLAWLERFLKKYIPGSIQLLLIPFLSLLIMVPLTMIVVGPIGVYVGKGLAIGITTWIAKAPVITGMVLSAIWIFVVMFGLHWAVMPIIINNITTLGGDPIMGLLMGTVWTAVGTALGVMIKAKDPKLREVAISGFIPSFFSGVSEPIMYGILFRYKRTLIYAIVMNIISGGVAGLLHIKATQVTGGIFTIPTFNPMGNYLILIAVSVIGTVLLYLVFGFDDSKKDTKPNKLLNKQAA